MISTAPERVATDHTIHSGRQRSCGVESEKHHGGQVGFGLVRGACLAEGFDRAQVAGESAVGDESDGFAGPLDGWFVLGGDHDERVGGGEAGVIAFTSGGVGAGPGGRRGRARRGEGRVWLRNQRAMVGRSCFLSTSSSRWGKCAKRGVVGESVEGPVVWRLILVAGAPCGRTAGRGSSSGSARHNRTAETIAVRWENIDFAEQIAWVEGNMCTATCAVSGLARSDAARSSDAQCR